MLSVLLKDRRTQIAVGVMALLGVIALVVAWQMGVTIETAKGWVSAGLKFLEHRPVLIFFAIVLLPALPFPVSALLILAGVVYGEAMGIPLACLVAYLGMLLNASWTYWVARKPGRAFIEGWLSRLSIELPELPKEDHVRLALIMRLTPGVPQFVQNYALGLAKVPFGPYMLVSAPAMAFWTVGFVVSAGAIFKGKFGIAVVGISVIVVAVLLTNMLRRRFGTAPKTPEVKDA